MTNLRSINQMTYDNAAAAGVDNSLAQVLDRTSFLWPPCGTLKKHYSMLHYQPEEVLFFRLKAPVGSTIQASPCRFVLANDAQMVGVADAAPFSSAWLGKVDVTEKTHALVALTAIKYTRSVAPAVDVVGGDVPPVVLVEGVGVCSVVAVAIPAVDKEEIGAEGVGLDAVGVAAPVS
ncbi:uncharacterized protein KY384_005772 [Bacidia gigantensis]|uniref:uncharacterized protein n=1 Tax=Bacidia gigantensis TaxID=2732470 RepID=UPI001D0377CF|nr:uncharacterized protein KY384_005772 [Bacidia gigantensis]KAG8529137.1 hypothetical protein KY384_005772 [Bacidia gigantensis]